MAIERHDNLTREAWLQFHEDDFTASRTPDLFGHNPYCSQLRLYHEKAKLIELPQRGDDKVLRRGRLFESAVGAAVQEERPQWRIEKATVYLRDPDLKFGCTPDFFIHGDPRGLGLLQTKTCAPSVFKRDWQGISECPFNVILQVLAEATLVDPAFCVVAALCIDPFDVQCKIVEVPRHPATEQKITKAIAQFWQDVRDGREPGPDYNVDRELLEILTPRETPGITLNAYGDNELIAALVERADLKEAIAKHDKRCKAIEAFVMDRMGDAESVVGVPDFKVTWKTQHRNGYTVEPKDLRVLRILDRRADDEEAAA